MCAAVSILAITACDKTPTKPADERMVVVTTFTIIADMAREVAGDAAIVESLIKPGAEIHGYEPTPKDIVRAQKADLILSNGMNLEAWFAKFFQHLDKVPNVVVSEGIEPIGISGGPYEGKKSIGCSLLIGPEGMMAQGKFNEFAGELIVGEFEVPTPAAKGTDIGKMLENKGYKFDVIEK